jgi:acyl carrier protein
MSEPSRAELAQLIEGAIHRILTDSGRQAPPCREQDRLGDDLGLDSLDQAMLVVSLEQRLRVDPFRAGRGLVRTFGELVTVYQEALDSKP